MACLSADNREKKRQQKQIDEEDVWFRVCRRTTFLAQKPGTINLLQEYELWYTGS
ncbi:hypothetical protein OS493_039010, partial [Desmophyllum pertusum]